MTVGIVGVGFIGELLVEALWDADREVVAHDARADRVEAAVDAGASAAADAAEVGRRADAVLLALPGAPEVTTVALDEGLLDAMAEGATLVDTSTTGPDAAERVAAAAAERGVTFLTAPVTRGGPGEGMHAMAGGDPDAYAGAADLLDDVTLGHARIGSVAEAQRFKLLVQLRYAGHEAVDAEVVAAGRDRDLPVSEMNDLLDFGVDERLFDDAFGEDVPGLGGFRIWKKDLGYLVADATETGTAVPLATEVHAAYKHADRVREADDLHHTALLRHWRRLDGD